MLSSSFILWGWAGLGGCGEIMVRVMANCYIIDCLNKKLSIVLGFGVFLFYLVAIFSFSFFFIIWCDDDCDLFFYYIIFWELLLLISNDNDNNK